MNEKCLSFTESLHGRVLGSVVYCTGGVIRDIVLFEVDRVPDEFAHHCAEVHEGNVYENEASAVA